MTVSQLTFQNTFDTESSTNPTFTLDYQFFNNSELRVILNGTVLTEGTAQDQYTPIGANSGSVGSVQLNGSYSAGTANLIITRVIPLTQSTDLQTNSTFDAEAQEDQFDKLTAIAQQSLGIDTTRGEHYDAGSRKITNVANGENPKDAVNYEQLAEKVFEVAPVQSVNTQTGVVVLDTSDIAENTNLYYTNARASAAAPIQTVTGTNITVTTDGAGNVNITGPTGSASGGSVPVVSGADDGKMVDVSGGVYRVASSGTIRSTLGLATTDDVTFRDVNVGVDLDVAGASQLDGNLVVGVNKFTVTASSGNTAIVGTLDVTGNATFTGDVTVTDDLQIQNNGHIKAQSGGVGVNVDCTNAQGSLHVQESSGVTDATTGPSNTVILAQSDTADHTGLCIMGRARNANDDHDIKFAIRNETGMTTGIRSTRAASQASDSMGLFVNAKKVIDIQDAAVDFGGSTGGDTRLKNVEDAVDNKDAVNLGQLKGSSAETMIIHIGATGIDGTPKTVNYGGDSGSTGDVVNRTFATAIPLVEFPSTLPSWCTGTNTSGNNFTVKSGTYHVRYEIDTVFLTSIDLSGALNGAFVAGLASGTVNNQLLGRTDNADPSTVVNFPSNARSDLHGEKTTGSPFSIEQAISDTGNPLQANYTHKGAQSFQFGTYADGATHAMHPFVTYGYSGSAASGGSDLCIYGRIFITREEIIS